MTPTPPHVPTGAVSMQTAHSVSALFVWAGLRSVWAGIINSIIQEMISQEDLIIEIAQAGK